MGESDFKPAETSPAAHGAPLPDRAFAVLASWDDAFANKSGTPAEAAVRRIAAELSFALSCRLFRDPDGFALCFYDEDSVDGVPKEIFGIETTAALRRWYDRQAELAFSFDATRADVSGFLEAARFALSARGTEWRSVEIRRGEKNAHLNRYGACSAADVAAVFPRISQEDAELAVSAIDAAASGRGGSFAPVPRSKKAKPRRFSLSATLKQRQ